MPPPPYPLTRTEEQAAREACKSSHGLWLLASLQSHWSPPAYTHIYPSAPPPFTLSPVSAAALARFKRICFALARMRFYVIHIDWSSV